MTTLLGYDREFLLTPAWDKVVYHVRLPSGNAEISSLQLEELEFERAHETILVVAAPAWISRQKVLAELPYQRFDNTAWQHLRLDGTLSAEEIERFRGMCYDDPLLYHKLGVHVFEKIRGQGGTSPIMPSTSTQLAPGGVSLNQPLLPINAYGQTQAMEMLPQATAVPLSPPLQLTAVSQAGAALPAPEHFGAQVRTLFALRGYQVTGIEADSGNSLLLTKGGKRAVAMYHWQPGMVTDEPVRPLLELMTTWQANHGYFVTNGNFTLQVEDLVANRPVQLIDGAEFSALVDGTRSMTEPATVAAEPRANDHVSPPDDLGAIDLAAHLGENAHQNGDSPRGDVAADAPGAVEVSAEPVDAAKTRVLSQSAPPVEANGATRVLSGTPQRDDPEAPPAVTGTAESA
ncbi:MAG TPA: restriction endonuclease [Chloroflexota bacterium]|nr:restriction endonuclease [Chloroflexota bacterium]